MAIHPTPTIKGRVNMHILPSSDAKQSIELDYRLFIVGDFSKKETADKGELKGRKILEIKSARDFKNVLKFVNPKLKLVIDNKLSDDPEAKFEIELDIQDMKDFHPDEIVKKVKPLAELLAKREQLKKLKMAIIRTPKIIKEIEETLKDEKNVDLLRSKLSEGNPEPQE